MWLTALLDKRRTERLAFDARDVVGEMEDGNARGHNGAAGGVIDGSASRRNGSSRDKAAEAAPGQPAYARSPAYT